jgi:hypothetical protein
MSEDRIVKFEDGSSLVRIDTTGKSLITIGTGDVISQDALKKVRAALSAHPELLQGKEDHYPRILVSLDAQGHPQRLFVENLGSAKSSVDRTLDLKEGGQVEAIIPAISVKVEPAKSVDANGKDQNAQAIDANNTLKAISQEVKKYLDAGKSSPQASARSQNSMEAALAQYSQGAHQGEYASAPQKTVIPGQKSIV